MELLLQGKNAIVYGAGGGIGGGVARTFAREGAPVFLAGRTREPLEAVAADITAAGGAAEVGPQGVRVVGIYTAGVADLMVPERMEKLAAVAGEHMLNLDPAVIVQGIAGGTMLRRAPGLAEVADAAAFLASDRASGITGTIVNVTCGLLPG